MAKALSESVNSPSQHVASSTTRMPINTNKPTLISQATLVPSNNQAIKNIDWTNKGIDGLIQFLVTLFGVALGYWWGQWSERKSRRERKNALIVGLLEELHLIDLLLVSFRTTTQDSPVEFTFTLFESTAREQVELFKNKKIHQMLPMLRWHFATIKADLNIYRKNLYPDYSPSSATQEIATKARSRFENIAKTLKDGNWIVDLIDLLKKEYGGRLPEHIVKV